MIRHPFALLLALPLSAWAQERVPLRIVSEVSRLQNPGFEAAHRGVRSPSGWQTGTTLPGAELTWLRTDARTGTCCVHTRAANTGSNKWAWWRQTVPVRPGGRYRLSGYIRAKGCRRAGFGLHWWDGDRKLLKIMGTVAAQDTGGKWQHLSQDYVAPTGAAFANVHCTLQSYGEVWFDDVSFAELAIPAHMAFDSVTSYPCMRSLRPVTIDGKLDEWAGVPHAGLGGIDTYTQAEEIVSRGDRGTAADDLSAKMRLAYDDERLCLAIELRDNRFPVVRRPYWKGDSIQLALDLGHQRTPRLDRDDVALGFAPRERTLAVQLEYGPQFAKKNLRAIQRALTTSPGAAVVEIAIPWSVLPASGPRPAATLGFSLLINDSDGQGRKWIEWGSGIARGKRPAAFGTLVLFDRASDVRAALSPSPAEFNDSEPAVLWLHVSALDARPGLTAQLRLDNGRRWGEVAQRFEARRGVTAVPLYIDLKNLDPGPWRVQAAVVEAGQTLCRAASTLTVFPLVANLRGIEARAEGLHKAAQAAEALAARRKQEGFNVERQSIALALAEPLREYALYDVRFREHQALAAKQIRELSELVQACTEQLERARDRSAAYVEPDLSRLTIRDGYFHAGDRPVLLCGFNAQPADDASMPLLKRLGVNVMPMSIAPGWTATGMDSFRTDAFAATLDRTCRLAARHNCRVDVLFGHGIRGMKWLVKQHPDVTDGPGHFVDYDIDHPAVRTLWAGFLETFGPLMAKKRQILTYDLSNEPNFPRFSKRTTAKFRTWLKGQYRSIAKLNEAWGTGYAAFDQAQPRVRPEKSRAAWYDWCMFNRVRVTDFYRHIATHLRRHDADALLHVKQAGEVMFTGSRSVHGRPLELSRHDDGLDREWLCALYDVHGTDVRPVHKPFRATAPMALDWQGQAMTFDFMKSIAPHKPIFDSEWHAVQTVYYESNDIPGEHMETALWLAHLHGMAGNIIWWWSRRDGPEHRGQWFSGSLLVQPKLMEAYARTMLQLKRLLPAVMPLANGPRPIRFHFSRASAIQDVHYLDELWKAYEGANFLGRGLGFVTDRQIERNELEGCAMLVVAHARFVPQATLAGLRRFAARGGAVALIGPDNAKFDPWGRPREAPAIRGANVHRLAVGTSRSYYEALLPLADAACPAAPVRVAAVDGRPPWGVETRSVQVRGRWQVYAVNVSPDPVVVGLKPKGAKARLLHGGAVLDGRSPLAPLRPVLLDCTAD